MAAFDFSVIIPSHNRPDLLRRTLESLNQQSLSANRFEVIVILSPEDISLPFLQNASYNYKLHFEAPPEDIWQGRNVSFKRNYGATIAKADWLAFTDDDCVPTKNWLEVAMNMRNQPGLGGIEGKTITPVNSPRTLTWKGMQRLGRPGGYQTCNIFYQKKDFIAAGGFDAEKFPWFLEDTALAWSVLQSGKELVFAESAIVEHPVGEAAPWRILHEAKGAGLKLRLYKNFPRLYRQKRMRIFRPIHYLYLFLWLGIVGSAILLDLHLLADLIFVLLVLGTAHTLKQFYGMKFAIKEWLQVLWYSLLFPVFALHSTLKARRQLKMSVFTFLRLIGPF